MATISGYNLIGEVNLPVNPSVEYFEQVCAELERFMKRHNIDKIDVSWSRAAILKEAAKQHGFNVVCKRCETTITLPRIDQNNFDLRGKEAQGWSYNHHGDKTWLCPECTT